MLLDRVSGSACAETPGRVCRLLEHDQHGPNVFWCPHCRYGISFGRSPGSAFLGLKRGTAGCFGFVSSNNVGDILEQER